MFFLNQRSKQAFTGLISHTVLCFNTVSISTNDGQIFAFYYHGFPISTVPYVHITPAYYDML